MRIPERMIICIIVYVMVQFFHSICLIGASFTVDILSWVVRGSEMAFHLKGKNLSKNLYRPKMHLLAQNVLLEIERNGLRKWPLITQHFKRNIIICKSTVILPCNIESLDCSTSLYKTLHEKRKHPCI